MTVFISSDHRGFELKQQLAQQLAQHQIIDLGPSHYDPEDDFNDASISIAQAVISHPGSFGILICGSAHGVAIQANRFKGIRAIAAYDPELASIGRLHNDANILCLSADRPTDYLAIIQTFLQTEFLALPRYKRRNQRLDQEAHG